MSKRCEGATWWFLLPVQSPQRLSQVRALCEKLGICDCLLKVTCFLPAVYKELSLIEQQHINIKFLAKLSKNGHEIFEEVYENNSLKKLIVNKWLKWVRGGREEYED